MKRRKLTLEEFNEMKTAKGYGATRGVVARRLGRSFGGIKRAWDMENYEQYSDLYMKRGKKIAQTMKGNKNHPSVYKKLEEIDAKLNGILRLMVKDYNNEITTNQEEQPTKWPWQA